MNDLSDLSELKRLIEHCHAKYRNDTSGKVDPHVAALGRVDPDPFGIAEAISIASLIKGQSPDGGVDHFGAKSIHTIYLALIEHLNLIQNRRGSIDKSAPWK